MEETKLLAKDGVKEIVIIAQDVTRYGLDLYNKLALPELLDKLCEIEGLKWIRLLYCYPERVTDELIDCIKRQDKIVKYLDIPMQHCSDEILKRMNRKTTGRGTSRACRKAAPRDSRYHAENHVYHRLPWRDRGAVQRAGRIRRGDEIRAHGLLRLLRGGGNSGGFLPRHG